MQGEPSPALTSRNPCSPYWQHGFLLTFHLFSSLQRMEHGFQEQKDNAKNSKKYLHQRSVASGNIPWLIILLQPVFKLAYHA